MQVRTLPSVAFTLACSVLLAWAWGPTNQARAGGPLLVQDPATRTPFAYAVFPVSVYTDLGPLGIFDNAMADSLAAVGFDEWSSVPTSSFDASVVGDLGALGLGDIDGSNANQVIGPYNGGGIHVLYDDDGQILSGLLGAPPGVLGVSSPEYGAGSEILESWVVLAGPEIAPTDSSGANFAGVFVHEFGHSINLAHSQTNGAMIFFGDDTGPGPCPTPYVDFPTSSQIETMYPFLDVLDGGTGAFAATVDQLDDVTMLSDLYPASNWPSGTATITGIVYDIDGVSELTGINVIARNILDPFSDCVSAISGDFTQGDLGPDGLFTFTGLTPGADYVVYIDRLVAGTFSTPPGVLAADEEYWDLAEAGDRVSDPPCNYSTMAVGSNKVGIADIYANAVPAPSAQVTPPGLQLSVPESSFEYVTLDLANDAPVGSDDLVWTSSERAVFAKADPAWPRAKSQRPRFEMARARAHRAPLLPELSTGAFRLAAGTTSIRRANLTNKLGSVLDGGFELGGVWNEYSLNFVTPICNLSLCGDGSGTGPRSGNNWAWFGGLAGATEVASVSQTVTIPSGSATLIFYLEQPVCDSAADWLEVVVDGDVVFATDGSAAACGQIGYASRSVDLSAYADGGSHLLEFRAETSSVNGGVTNFFVDDIDIVAADCPWLSSYPDSGILAPGSSEPIDLSVDTSGLGAGSYRCDLVIESNAEPESTLTVSVDLNVVGSVVMHARSAASQRVALFTTPEGQGDSFSQAQAWNGVPASPPTLTDATITVTLLDLAGTPIQGFPAEAIQLVSSLDGLQPCAPDTTADHDTDAAGQTVFQLPRRAGGGTDPLQGEVLQITVDGVHVADAVYGDETMYGSDRFGNLFALDLATGAGTLVCTLPSAATEIEYDKNTGMAWCQEPNTGFTAHRFSMNDCAEIGTGVYNGATYQSLEFIGTDLYGVASPSTCSNSSLRILDPSTGSATVIGPTGIGPVSGLAWDRDTYTLYGVTGCSQSVPDALVTINIYSGAATQVGLTGVSLGSLQFGPDGLLYAGGSDRDGGNLYRIDPLTGQTTLIGPTGFSGVTGLTLFSPYGLDVQIHGPDLAVDGLVNLLDVGAFAQDYFSPYSFAVDYQWDGLLNLLDVAAFAQSLGESCANPAPAPPLEETSTLGIFFDRDGLRPDVDLEPDEWVPAYVVLRGAAVRFGVRAWSGHIETSDNVEIQDWALSESTLNLAEAPDFLVGHGRSAPEDEPIVLLSMRLRVRDREPASVSLISLAEQRSVQLVLDGSAPPAGILHSAAATSARINAADDPDTQNLVFRGYDLRAVPNPFNPSTTLYFDLPRPGKLSAELYDVRGRHVRTLGPMRLGAGAQSILWRGEDDRGNAVTSGVYLCRLHLDGRPVGDPLKINLVR